MNSFQKLLLSVTLVFILGANVSLADAKKSKPKNEAEKRGRQVFSATKRIDYVKSQLKINRKAVGVFNFDEAKGKKLSADDRSRRATLQEETKLLEAELADLQKELSRYKKNYAEHCKNKKNKCRATDLEEPRAYDGSDNSGPDGTYTH